MSKTVLVVGAGRRASALCKLLCERDDVRRVFLTPARALPGNPKTQRAPIPEGDVQAQVRFALGRDVALIVEGPGGDGLCSRLRAMHSFRFHRPGSDDALAAAIWASLPCGSSSAWRVAAPPAPAESHLPYVPIRHECERDKAYVFSLAPKEQST